MDGKALVHMDVEGARQVSSRSTLSRHSADKSVSVVCQPVCVCSWGDTGILIRSACVLALAPPPPFLCFAAPLHQCGRGAGGREHDGSDRWLLPPGQRHGRHHHPQTKQECVDLDSCSQSKGEISQSLLLIVCDFYVPPRCHLTKCPS